MTIPVSEQQVQKAPLILYALLFVLCSLFAVLALPKIAYAQDPGGVRCACVDPTGDGCACLEEGTNGESWPASLGDVDVICGSQVLATSFFNIANPVCGTNAEIVPTCTGGASGGLMCWGTAFGGPLSPSSIPINSMDWVDVPGGVVSFNGDTWNTDTVFTCASNVYCCGDAGNCDGEGQPPYGTCPSSGGPAPESPAEAACGNITVNNMTGAGESRIWVSQDRLVSALSMMAQTMFNPYGLNELYLNTAFSKNADQVDRDNDTSGNIHNLSSVTTRVRKHQGIDDGTVVVNTHANNSSVIVGRAAPPPLDPFYSEFQDRACYVEETYQNPGDDLIGAKIRGEMLFTEQFTYAAKGRPVGCTDDGGTWRFDGTTDEWNAVAAEECKENCCSDVCVPQPWSNECLPASENPPYCPPINIPELEDYGLGCPGDIIPPEYCCYSRDAWCEQEYVDLSCSRPAKATIPVGADANVFDKTPIIESIYDTVLDGTDSLFRRFFPLPENKKYEFDDIPTKSPFGANASVAPLGTVAGGFNLRFARGQVGAPELYFPHLGDLHQYWLQDFQKAIRPEGTVVEYSGNEPPPPPPIPSDSCEGPAPYSGELSSIIDTARSGASAASLVPKEVLEAIYFIESFGQWNDPSYDCSANPWSALGLMQITDTAYRWVVPPDQRIADEHLCEPQAGAMSRCNVVDAIELAARVLLVKIGQWDFANFEPIPGASLNTLKEVYCSSAGYYGSTVPDTATDARARDRNVPPGYVEPCRNNELIMCDTNYSEIVCYDSGFCASSADYPSPRPSAGSCMSTL